MVRHIRSSNTAAAGTVALLVAVTAPSGPSVLISVFKQKLESVTWEKQVAHSCSTLSSPCPVENGKLEQNFRFCVFCLGLFPWFCGCVSVQYLVM